MYIYILINSSSKIFFILSDYREVSWIGTGRNGQLWNWKIKKAS